MRNKVTQTALTRKSRLTDAKLLLIITICVFAVMYVCAVLFLGSGFKKPQTFFNILNENAALLILSCGMSLVMITGGIDISVGTLTALVCMSCAVHLDYQGGTMLTGGVGNIIGTLFGVLSLSTIKNIVSSLGLDEAWWTNITVAAMICLFLVIQSLVLSRKNKDE